MKKTILLTLWLLACASLCVAGDISVIELTVANITTNALSSTSTNAYAGPALTGWVIAVDLDLTGESSPDVDIDVMTGTGGSGKDRTILSKDDITADTLFPVMDQTVNTAGTAITGQGQRIPLWHSLPYLVAGDCNKANVNAVVRLFFETP